MTGLLKPDRAVRGLEKGLGEFRVRESAIGEDQHRLVPLFDQILDPRTYSVAFAPDSEAYQVLANDQNRFTPPRSLPPIVDLRVPEDPDNGTGAYVITRHAYTEGAFDLLEGLLGRGHVFGMNGFLEFARSLTQALAWLHEHGIVHGQWNARSVIAVSTEELAHPLLEVSNHRFEVIGTGICFADAAAVPREYVERGYYPPEVFLAGCVAPDYGALDLVGDVYCCAAFLKDLMQRYCSPEELPSQAQRILEELHKEAVRRGWKAAPESVQRKEMEVIDHLYTIRVRSETLIQEAMRPRGERSTAAELQSRVEYLHGKARAYLQELFTHGFDPVNVFDGQLQHYTTFKLEVAPRRVNACADSKVVLSGTGLPHEVVRVTLNESHHGVRVLSARPDRIEFEVAHGMRSGSYRIAVNNRRTNATLEVFAPVWQSLLPAEVHQPWEGFGNLRLTVSGRDLPLEVDYRLRPRAPTGAAAEGIAAAVVEPAIGEGGEPGVQLTFPCDTVPGEYQLFANGLPTALWTRVLERLPEPVLDAAGLQPAVVKNHRAWTLQLAGRDFHTAMKVDFGKETPPGLRLDVRSSAEAGLTVPAGFPAGQYRLRLNYRETEAQLRVIEPHWQAVEPGAVKLLRKPQDPVQILLTGDSLPDPAGNGYSLASAGGQVIPDSVLATEEAEAERAHRLQLAPDLPRGQCTVRFGGLDTGLRLQIHRQWPRAAWATLLVATVTLLAGAGYLLHEVFAPRITAIAPDTLFAFGEPAVTVQGSHLASVQLLDPNGGIAGSFPVEQLVEQLVEQPDGDGYRFVPHGLPPGRYRLRPMGLLYGSDATELHLTLLSPSFRLEPATVMRLEDTEIRLSAAEGFDVARVPVLELHAAGLDGAARSRPLPLASGRATVARGSFTRDEEGEYRVTIAGLHDSVGSGEVLAIRVVGPKVAAIAPNPVTLGADGGFALHVTGSNLGQPLVLLPEGGEEGEAVVFPLQGGRDGDYRDKAPTGSYRLALAPADLPRELVRDIVLTVLPHPAIAAVMPDKLEPDQQATIAVTGVNLEALNQVALQPAAAGAQPIEAALQRRDGAWVFEAALPSGTYSVTPATGTVTLDVYDDCRAALRGFADTGEKDTLLRCLQTGRPPAEVRNAAAELLFDRGLFAAAADLYRGRDDLVARFRWNFVEAFVGNRAVPLIVPKGQELATQYAVAVIRLGWAGAGKAEFEAGPLPWELEYVRGRTAASPAEAVASLQTSIEKKTRASGGFEAAAFEPAHRDLAAARLDLALDSIAHAQVPRAAELLRGLVAEDGADFRRLSPERQTTALFWHGHILIWYAGDEAAAKVVFQRARELPGPAASWSQVYLAALARENAPAAVASGWQQTFVRLFQLHREATELPNYDLLMTAADKSGSMSAGERKKSAELNELLQSLEQLEPMDPFAHLALLHELRQAQLVSWPAHARRELAVAHRSRLQGLALPPELESLRRYYVVYGDLAPYDYSQVVSLDRSERSEMAYRLEALEGLGLPPAFCEAAKQLKGRFLGPSVIWWRQAKK